MTTCFVNVSGTIELYFYGELDEPARAEAERHLAGCPECRLLLEELREIRAALAARPDVCAPPSGDWSGFMARLDATIHASTDPGAAAPPRGGWLRRHAGYIAMAALLALITLSVAHVVRLRSTDVPADSVPAGALAGAAGESRPWTADAAFASLTEQHFERSKLVVLGLINKDAQDAATGEWEYERDLAGTLLNDTRLYRQAAEERGMASLARVMGDLELVLLQAALSEDPDPATLEQIQSLIRKRDLVTKMNVMASTGL